MGIIEIFLKAASKVYNKENKSKVYRKEKVWQILALLWNIPDTDGFTKYFYTIRI